MFLRKLLHILLYYFPLLQNKYHDCLYLDHTAKGCQHELSFLPQACFSQRRNLTLPDKPSVSGHLNKATLLNDISLQLTYNHQQMPGRLSVTYQCFLLLQTLKGTRWVWTNSHNTAMLERAQQETLVDMKLITVFFWFSPLTEVKYFLMHLFPHLCKKQSTWPSSHGEGLLKFCSSSLHNVCCYVTFL